MPVTSLFLNKKVSIEELKEENVLGEINESLEWFISLTPQFKSHYIGRGHALSIAQFDYLFDYKLDGLLNQYLNTGNQLTTQQVDKMLSSTNVLKTYVRNQYQELGLNKNYEPNYKFVSFFSEFGYLNDNRNYPNGKSDDYYKTVLTPTIEGIYNYYLNVVYGDTGLLMSFSSEKFVDNKFIQFVVNNQHYDVMEVLIKNGLDCTTNNNYALRYASKKGQLKIVELLLVNGANVVAHANESLREASGNGHLEVVKVLVEAGSDVGVMCNCPIRLASKNGHSEVVKYLIGRGANPFVMKNYPIRKASKYGHLDVVKLLVKNGADVTAVNNDALMNASIGGYVTVVQFLLENGPNAEDQINNVIKRAMDFGKFEIVELLNRYEAKC